MSSRSAVNQEHKPASAAPDTMTSDLLSLCDLWPQWKGPKRSRPSDSHMGFTELLRMMKFFDLEKVWTRVREPSAHGLYEMLQQRTGTSEPKVTLLSHQRKTTCSDFVFVFFSFSSSPFVCYLCRGRQALRVREHKVLGPYVDGLSRLAVTSYKVNVVLDNVFCLVTTYFLTLWWDDVFAHWWQVSSVSPDRTEAWSINVELKLYMITKNWKPHYTKSYGQDLIRCI